MSWPYHHSVLLFSTSNAVDCYHQYTLKTISLFSVLLTNFLPTGSDHQRRGVEVASESASNLGPADATAAHLSQIFLQQDDPERKRKETSVPITRTHLEEDRKRRVSQLCGFSSPTHAVQKTSRCGDLIPTSQHSDPSTMTLLFAYGQCPEGTACSE